MDYDTLTDCIEISEVNNTRVLSVQSMINFGIETLNKTSIDKGLKELQDKTVNQKITTQEGNYLIIFEELSNNEYVTRVNPYDGLYNKDIDDTQEYIDELREKYGKDIPDIRTIINKIKENEYLDKCQGVAFDSITYNWFDPQTLQPTLKKLYYTTENIGNRKFIIGAGISVSRIEETIFKNQLQLRSIRLRMILLFIVCWGLIGVLHYYMFKKFTLVFIITGMIGIFVVYIQILRPFATKDEPDIYDSLNSTLKALVVTSASLIVLISRIKLSQQKEKPIKYFDNVLYLVFVCYIISVCSFLINPRKQNIIKLHQINDILRVIIALSVTSLITALIITFL